MHTSNQEYRTELNRHVRASRLTTRDYLADEHEDPLLPLSGQASKRYRKLVRADRDCMVLRRKSGF